MSLVTTKEMFEKSMKEGFAIGAFNVNNMEIIQGIVDAAAKENSPVILQVSSGAIKYARIPYLKKMIEAALEEHDIPIALHLDHGPDFETCKMCIDNGFTSVMIDGSKYDFEENVALTKKVVDYAHSKGVVVEAELGKLAGIEDDVNVAESDAMYTDPDHICVDDPGKVEGNVVFTYLDVFCKEDSFSKYLPEYKNLEELKNHYRRGGLGDVKIKKFLYEVLEEELKPIRERREELAKNPEYVYQVLREGTRKAREKASETLKEVKKAMLLDYFEEQ